MNEEKLKKMISTSRQEDFIEYREVILWGPLELFRKKFVWSWVSHGVGRDKPI